MALYRSPDYQLNWPLVQEKKCKTDFQDSGHDAIFDFWSEHFQLFFIYKTPWCFLPSLDSVGLSVQEKKRKIDF